MNDLTQGHGLLHGQQSVVFADAGYQGVTKRAEATGVEWQVAMRPGKRRARDKNSPWGRLAGQGRAAQGQRASQGGAPFRVIKCQFGFTKVRYKGLTKNTAQLVTLFALSNLWMARRHLMGGRA